MKMAHQWCVHGAPAADQEQCNRTDILEQTVNSMTWLSARIYGAESTQTDPITCHLVPWH